MCADISSEDLEIIHDFIVESRDMIEQLEPTIVELGNSCRGGNCWEILACGETGCPRHGKSLDFPCWLHMGYLGGGQRSCRFADSEAGFLACAVGTAVAAVIVMAVSLGVINIF
jgi:two-component system chemotaxis sensor kinase CheA